MSKHIARKRFGQNFLIDVQVIGAIVGAVAPQRGDCVVEIGPGLGALTEPLLQRLERLHVVEIDRDIVARLRKRYAPEKLTIHEGDALVFEHERLIARMNQFFDRVESQLRQCLRLVVEANGSPTPTVETQAMAAAITALIIGRLQRYARSGFRRLPTEAVEAPLQRLSA